MNLFKLMCLFLAPSSYLALFADSSTNINHEQASQCNVTSSQLLTIETSKLLPGGVVSSIHGELSSVEDISLINITHEAYPITCDEYINYQHYSQRSVCPWTFVKNIDENRIPSVLTEAKCINRSVHLNGKSCHCKEIKYYAYVLRRIKRTGNSYVYQSILEPISAGCSCFNPPSSRRRIIMPQYIHSKKRMTFFQGMTPDETLEKFLDREVRPDTEFLTNCSRVIDTVVRLIHRIPRYSVNQVIKGGSLGKGTAVRGHSDVDLLVVLNNFKDVEDLKENMHEVLSDFRKYLISQVQNGTSEDVEIKMTGQTPFTLQFRLRCSSDWSWFDVDLLPIKDVWSSWLLGLAGGVQSTYNTIEANMHLRKHYAKSLAKLQVEFVKPVPSRVKDLIRLLKYWKYTEMVDLTSYCIELLVIYVWRENGSQNNFTMKQLMTKVVDLLANFGKTTVAFDDIYSSSKYIEKWNRTPPYVLDPANPFHDTSSDPEWSFSTFRRDFSRIESKGKQLQRKLGVLPEEVGGCVIS